MAPQQALSRLASWRSWMTTSMWGCNMVKIEAIPRSYTIPRDEEREGFPVLVRVTAPPLPTPRGAGVDVVALLDVSKSMEGDKLEHVRKAMDIFIGMLASDDRLSIVSFDGNPERLMGLTGMSGEGQADARGKIAALKAGGSTNMAAALSAGAEILRDRAEGKRRVGCMIFLSDGDSKEIYNKHINNDYPVHTFGLGGDHNPHVLHHIADKTLGTYSYVNNDVADIHGALKQFISDLTTVVAMDVEIAVEAHDGVSISSIHSGGYKVFVDPERRRGKIYINEMYAGEIKCFIVYLTVAEGSQEKLLTLHGVYQQSGAEKKSRDKLVVVRRSTATATAEVAAADELLAELTRIKLYDGIKKMVEEGEQGKEAVLTGDKLQDLWVKVKEDSAGVPAVKLTELESDIDMMKKGIEESKDHRESGLPYMLSWLTCHKWQRATIKDSPSNSTTFKVTKPDAPGLVLRLTTTPWRKTMTTWWSRYALSCGWFMLAAVFLYFAVAGAVLMLNSRWSTGRMVAGNATLDITGHAGWAKMEEDLHGMLTKAKADGETGSLFHHTTYSEINIHDEIKRYLYMAIVHATMLERRWQLGSVVVSGKVVRREVERYLQRMPKMVEGIVDIPSFHAASVEDIKRGMTRYLYSTIVQSSNLVAGETDDSIPADSKLSKTNNTTPTPTSSSPSDEVKSGAQGSTSSDHSASTEILIQKKTSSSSKKHIISWSSSTTTSTSSSTSTSTSVLQTWMSSSKQYAAVLVGSLTGTTARHVSKLEKELKEKDELIHLKEEQIQKYLLEIEDLKKGQITHQECECECQCDGDNAKAKLTDGEQRASNLEEILTENGIRIAAKAPKELTTEQSDG